VGRVAAADARLAAAAGAELIAWSWFDVTDWGRALITAMGHREFRAVMEHRDWARDAARAMAGKLDIADGVLHPPLAPFGWTAGRFYPFVAPSLTVDRVLDPAEAANWLGRVAPAVQDDLMAHGRVP
jgi:hypothetical protein